MGSRAALTQVKCCAAMFAENALDYFGEPFDAEDRNL